MQPYWIRHIAAAHAHLALAEIELGEILSSHPLTESDRSLLRASEIDVHEAMDFLSASLPTSHDGLGPDCSTLIGESDV